jgi:hypothetical protein
MAPVAQREQPKSSPDRRLMGMRTERCGGKKNPYPSQEPNSNSYDNMLDDVGKL